MMSELTQHRARKLYATTKSGITTIVLCATRPLLPQPPSHPSIKESPVTRVRREYGLWPSLPTRAPALRGFHFLSGGVRKPCFCFLPPMVCRDGRSAFGDPSVRLQLGEKRVSLKGNALESSRSSCSSRTNYEVVLEGFHEMAFVLFLTPVETCVYVGWSPTFSDSTQDISRVAGRHTHFSLFLLIVDLFLEYLSRVVYVAFACFPFLFSGDQST
ncbi:unnamed protein product [Ascophyllum nodosum]